MAERLGCKHVMKGGAPCGNRCARGGEFCSIHKNSQGGYKQCQGPSGSDGATRGCGAWILLKSDICGKCQKALRADQSAELAEARETMKELADEIVELRLASEAREKVLAKAFEDVEHARVLVDELRGGQARVVALSEGPEPVFASAGTKPRAPPKGKR